MALADVATLASDAAFKAKVKAAVVRAAVSVGFDTSKNDELTSFATAILRDPDVYATAAAYAVAADKNGDTTTVDTDAEIITAVNRVLLAMARR